MAGRPDYRSPEAAQYRRFYKTAIWKAIRTTQLATHPLCAMCEAEGRVTAATVCDHITPHKGNWDLFINGPFQSLCSQHHSSDAQRLERGSAAKVRIGLDGWPIESAETEADQAKRRGTNRG